MEPDFWHERWALNQIGFHQDAVNERLLAHEQQLRLTAGDHVLVPLCGKSRDMAHLLGRGFRVTGIELSDRACRDFFTENGLSFHERQDGSRRWFSGDGIDLLCGDFFEVATGNIPEVDAVYDRAALVALPPSMRPAYAEQLLRLAPPGSRILLITLDYEQSEMNGPPFSVPESEVRDFFDGACLVEKLASEDCLAREPRFMEKGLSRLRESTWLLTRVD